MTSSFHYDIRSPFPGVYATGEPGVNCYLVCGTERALLIDTGFGFGDLAGAGAELTPLPVTVVITHGHVDHISGAHRFPEALISEKDLPLTAGATPEGRRAMVQRFASSGRIPEGFDAEAWINAPAATFRPFADDAVFPLGGRMLSVIPTPGHTPGAVCLYDADAGLLFSGDTVVAGPTLMFLEHSLPLHVYAESIATLRARCPGVTAILPGHGEEPLDPALLKALQEGAEAIMRGEVTGEPMQTPLGSALTARFKMGSISYNPERM